MNAPGRVHRRVYTDQQVFDLEMDRLFGRAWLYIGHVSQVPNAGDFKTSFLGDMPVVVTRDEQGELRAFENRCAHRAAEFCRELAGNTKEFVCPYHQWSYSLSGALQGVPFRRGVRQGNEVHGGMPADFNTAEHHLKRAAELAPKSVGRVLDVARFFARRGRFSESFAWIARAEKIAPKDPKVLYGKAQTHIQAKKDLPAAKQLLEEYLRGPLNPDLPSREDALKLLKQASSGE